MEEKSLLSLFGFPQIIRFVKPRVDAITRRAMKVEADVKPVILRFADESFDFIYFRFIDFVNLGGSDVLGVIEIQIMRIRYGQADKIEAPIRNPFKVLVASAAPRGRIRRGEIGEVKAAPARQSLLRLGQGS